jgi:hypothetical protein
MDAADRAQIVIENNCGQDSLAVGGQTSMGQTVTSPGTSTGTMAQNIGGDTDITMIVIMAMIGLLIVILALKRTRRRRLVA